MDQMSIFALGRPSAMLWFRKFMCSNNECYAAKQNPLQHFPTTKAKPCFFIDWFATVILKCLFKPAQTRNFNNIIAYICRYTAGPASRHQSRTSEVANLILKYSTS
ncbi:hypothetical protein TWF132_011794 [Orbilia oligospora]|nr:hypothetical protein TWF132_011794 [Orbilia oligospora]